MVELLIDLIFRLQLLLILHQQMLALINVLPTVLKSLTQQMKLTGFYRFKEQTWKTQWIISE